MAARETYARTYGTGLDNHRLAGALCPDVGRIALAMHDPARLDDIGQVPAKAPIVVPSAQLRQGDGNWMALGVAPQQRAEQAGAAFDGAHGQAPAVMWVWHGRGPVHQHSGPSADVRA